MMQKEEGRKMRMDAEGYYVRCTSDKMTYPSRRKREEGMNEDLLRPG